MELAFNRRVKFDYDLEERIQAGLELTGHEVKSAKLGHINISGSYVTLQGNEAFVFGMAIPPFQPKNAGDDYDPERKRKLLLNKKELNELLEKKEHGRTIVLVNVFVVRNKIKVTIAAARGRKKYDKRAVIKKRDTKREIDRKLKSSTG